MQAIEFQAKVEDGVIIVPEQHRGEMIGQQVRVIILTEDKPEPYDIITELINNPLQISDFKPLTRDEIYSDKRFGD